MEWSDLFKTLVWDAAVRAALGNLISAAPILSMWPLGPVISWIVFKIGDFIFLAVKESVVLETVAFMNRAHREAFDREAIKLKLVAKNYGLESKEFREQRENAKVALSKFIRM